MNNKSEIDRFLNILEDTEQYENYYIFVQNRKKYGAENNGVYKRDVLKREKIINKLDEYITEDEYSARYIKINKSYSKYAIADFIREMTEELVENRTSDKIDNSISILKSCFHNCKSKRTFIDIDFDIPKEEYDIVQFFTNELNNNQVTNYIIETRGGYHVMMLVKTIKYNWTTTLDKVYRMARERIKEKYEIVINKQGTVPIPGTKQGGFYVRMLK
jgi:hypothetical protein